MDDSFDLLNEWLERKEKEEHFSVPAEARPLHFHLASSADPFGHDFLKGLYVLEHAMLEKGLKPSDFSIIKDRATAGYAYPGASNANIILYSYQISFHGNAYSVRREDDMDFLAYFSTLCLSEDHDADEDAAPDVRHASFFTRLTGWLKGDGFNPGKAD